MVVAVIMPKDFPQLNVLVSFVNLMLLSCSIVKGARSDVSKVVNADEFEYKDPVDGSVSKHQGIRFLFEDGSRLVSQLPHVLTNKKLSVQILSFSSAVKNISTVYLK